MSRLATPPLTALVALALSSLDSASALLERLGPLPDSLALWSSVLLVAGALGWIKAEPFKESANLSARDLRVLLALNRAVQGVSGVTIDELASASGIGRATVAESLSVLRAAGWVKRTDRKGGEPVRWALSDEALELAQEGRLSEAGRASQ